MTYAWSGEAKYPRFDDERIDGQIAEWVEKTMQRFLADAALSVEPDMDYPDRGMEVGVDYKVIRPSDKAVCVVLQGFSSHKPAAHPMSWIDTLTFSLEDGDRITFGTLFADDKAVLDLLSRAAPAPIIDTLRLA